MINDISYEGSKGGVGGWGLLGIVTSASEQAATIGEGGAVGPGTDTHSTLLAHLLPQN